MAEVKYPNVKVKLVGEDGNAYAILARCSKAMQRARCSTEEVDEFLEEAKSGDYDHLLQTCLKYFDDDDDDDDDDDEW